MTTQNVAWNLENFVDALVVELDRTRETLAIKSVNKPLSYTVKDMSLDLQLFPTYDGDKVKFITAQPGQDGASKVNIKLDSITDQVVRATSKVPSNRVETSIEELGIDEETKKELKKIGVNTVEDIENLERKNIDLKKTKSDKIDYTKLANMIKKTKRSKQPPSIARVKMSSYNGKPTINVFGSNLATAKDFNPVAVIDDQLVQILSYDKDSLVIDSSTIKNLSGAKQLVVALDPFSVMKVNLINDEA
jgi:hypothetical protein